MILARVVGTVVATQKDSRLSGAKLLVLRRVLADGALDPDCVVAVDTVGAGSGDTVIATAGAAVHSVDGLHNAPVDLAIVGIADAVTVGGKPV